MLYKKINAQDIQDNLFRKMTAEQKIKMSNNMFKFAKVLNKQYFKQWSKKNYCGK